MTIPERSGGVCVRRVFIPSNVAGTPEWFAYKNQLSGWMPGWCEPPNTAARLYLDAIR